MRPLLVNKKGVCMLIGAPELPINIVDLLNKNYICTSIGGFAAVRNRTAAFTGAAAC
jgi:hypothetical protein